MLKLFSISNLKTYLIVAGIIGAVWFYQSWKFRGEEMHRQMDNMEQLRKYDSLKFASQTYTKKELNDYLEYNRKDLQNFLDENKVSTRRIENIITQTLKYRDTAKQKTNLQPILDAIKEQKNFRVAVKDSTDCLVIKGFVAFENDTLSLDITDRQFNNITDVVSYWERNQWRLFGFIPTKLFGKKNATVIIKDACGKTKTLQIQKK